MTNNRRRPVRLQNRTQTAPEPTRARDSWYRIENRADEVPSIWLYDEVGLFGVGAAEFTKDLRNIKASQLDLHINSPGGDVFDGVTIMNALKNHPARVKVHVDGLAASAASFIMMAGDEIEVARNAQVMIHEGHAVCAGDSRDMRKCADLLDKVSNNIADIYAQRTGRDASEWRAVMREETWYTAEEAVEAGLADRVSGATKPENTWDLSVFMHAGRGAAGDPFEVWNRVAEPAVTTTVEAGVIRQALLNHAGTLEDIAEAEVVDLTGEPDDESEEEPFVVPDIADTIRAMHEIRVDMDLFRTAVQLGVHDVPAPDPRPAPPSPAPEPVFTYLPDVRRALKGAAL